MYSSTDEAIAMEMKMYARQNDEIGFEDVALPLLAIFTLCVAGVVGWDHYQDSRFRSESSLVETHGTKTDCKPILNSPPHTP